MQKEVELLEEVQKADAQLSSGKGVSNSAARSKILKSIES